MSSLEQPYDTRTVEYAKNKEQDVRDLRERLYAASLDRGGDRDPYYRDYARILYSSSFRRLQGKMQLLGIDQAHFFRNRLTHSLEVSQISRGIASKLGLETTLVAEASALAHDLGNPPFGHHGERVLNSLASSIGGYEGNAQTLRILMRLEKKHHAYRGLNLTLRTLLGVIKYPRLQEEAVRQRDGKPKFIYNDDYEEVNSKLQEKGAIITARSIDMQVMDLADEIAYAAHDLEDCLSIGYFTIEELLHEFRTSNDYKEAYGPLQDIVERCHDFAAKAHKLRSSEEYSFLFRKELTSQIVNDLVRDIHYRDTGDKPGLDYGTQRKLAKGLKKLIFDGVSRKPGVKLYEQRGEKIIKGLFEVYSDEAFDTGLMLLPPEYREDGDQAKRKRSVVDYISGMMDSFAVQEFARYFGESELNRLFASSS